MDAVEAPSLMEKEKKIGGLDRWNVESDLRSLKESESVRGDNKRIGAVKLLLKEEAGALAKVAQGVKGLGEQNEEMGYSMPMDH